MNADLFLPGCVLATKLGFRIFVDQRPRWVDAFRSLLMFPADMTFLSFSYGAAALTLLEATSNSKVKPSVTIGVALIGILFAFLTNRTSRAVEACFDEERYFFASVLAVVGYTIAAVVLYFSLHVGLFL